MSHLHGAIELFVNVVLVAALVAVFDRLVDCAQQRRRRTDAPVASSGAPSATDVLASAIRVELTENGVDVYVPDGPNARAAAMREAEIIHRAVWARCLFRCRDEGRA